MKIKWSKFSNELRIPVIFLILGGLWILLGDRLLGSLTSDVALFLKISTYKGLFFVIATTILLYVLLRLEFTRQRKLENQFQSLFDTAPDLLIITNAHGDILEVNKNLDYRTLFVSKSVKETGIGNSSLRK